MKRLFPALAFLMLLASGSEANACGGWCSRFFASVFGGQAVQVPNEETPLIVRPQQLPVQPPVLQIERRPVHQVGQPLVLQDEQLPVLIRRGAAPIDYAQALEVFRRAYRFTDEPREWIHFRDWLGGIRRLDVSGTTSYYVQQWGQNFVALAVNERGDGLLQYSARSSNELLDAGEAFGISIDTEVGVVARAIVAQGGPHLLRSITYHFNSREHLYFFSELTEGSRESLLEMGSYSHPANVLQRLLNYEAIDVDSVPDDPQSVPNDVWVRFGPRQDARDAHNEHRERLDDQEDEKKDEQ